MTTKLLHPFSFSLQSNKHKYTSLFDSPRLRKIEKIEYIVYGLNEADIDNILEQIHNEIFKGAVDYDRQKYEVKKHKKYVNLTPNKIKCDSHNLGYIMETLQVPTENIENIILKWFS